MYRANRIPDSFVHMQCRVRELVLPLWRPFRLAHGESHERTNVMLELVSDGSCALVGRGEAAVVSYYGNSTESIVRELSELAGLLGKYPASAARELLEPTSVLQASPAWARASAPARAAVDTALSDLWGQQEGVPLQRLLGLPSHIVPSTTTTVSWDHPDRMAARARAELPGPLKLKLGSRDAEACVRAVRGATAAPLRVDANGSWSLEEAKRLLPVLAQLGVELVEQPLAVGDPDGLRQLFGVTPRPVLLVDESIQTLDDIERHAGCADGIVVKLAKAGGVHPALAHLQRAGELGLSVMLSCMVESSIAVTAAAHIAGTAKWIDLDGPLLIRSEAWQGVRYEGRRLVLPAGSGLGLRPRG